MVDEFIGAGRGGGALRDVLLGEVLPLVERPSRYLGVELNSVHKEAGDVEVRLALAFPDLYDLGLGNLGLLILYEILNRLPWCWAERAYAPAPDMEEVLRERGLPLFAAESKDPLSCMDGIGFTLQSELTYTNVLNMIDLAGLPVRACDRDDSHPLVFAGGPCAFNPEPLAHFVDFFVIGDGEDVVVEVAGVLRACKGRGKGEKLSALAEVEGVYVPSLYPFDVLNDGRIVPSEEAPRIARRVVGDLDAAVYPTDYIVPYTEQVHDRVGIEVMRGCTQGCRFCLAGMTTRPVRERSLGRIDGIMDRALASTGYEEVSLVSLSTCDYSQAKALIDQAAARAALSRASVSLPSLRLDTFGVELADKVADVRRSGLTFAPEAATPRLRGVINKWITDDDLLAVASEVYRRGWGHVKTYFMIGLPTERDEDVEAIVDLCVRTLNAGRAITSRARVNTGVSTFVPKPFTPFQWAEQVDMEEAKRRQRILEDGFSKHGGIKFGRHDPAATFIEGLVTRSDRRAGDLIEAAWRRGAKFETWDEKIDLRAWLDAVDETGFDVKEALRARELDERLPWDHIDSLVAKSWLKAEWQRAMEFEHYPDCRHGECHHCGVAKRVDGLCERMWERSGQGRADKPADVCTPHEEEARGGAVGVQRIRFRIGRSGEARLLSNRELMNTWTRVLRRARAPLSYSQGFHAHPKITFSSAPPLGEESTGDYMDVVLDEQVEAERLLDSVRAALPRGLDVFEAEEVPLRAPSLMACVRGFSYSLHTMRGEEELRDCVSGVLASESLIVKRKPKQRRKQRGRFTRRRPSEEMVEVDLRPMLSQAEVRSLDNGESVIDLEVVAIGPRTPRMREILDLFGLDFANTRVVKRATHIGEPHVDQAEAGD